MGMRPGERFVFSEEPPGIPVLPLSTSDDGLQAPAVEVYRAQDRLIVKAQMPGFEPEEIDVWGEERAVTVQAQHTHETAIEHAAGRGRRTVSGSFQLQVELPYGVDPDQMSVAYENGVLEIVLPQQETQATS